MVGGCLAFVAPARPRDVVGTETRWPWWPTRPGDLLKVGNDTRCGGTGVIVPDSALVERSGTEPAGRTRAAQCHVCSQCRSDSVGHGAGDGVLWLSPEPPHTVR